MKPVATSPESAALEARIRDLVRDQLDARSCEIHWLPGQLGLRRFARVSIPRHDLPHVIARVDQPEDPASRPTGVPPEPPLEPIRALLEQEGLPVPRRFAHAPDIEILEDVGDTSLRDALTDATPETRRLLFHAACDLVPALQRVSDPGDVDAFRRHLDAPLFAYKAELFVRFSLPERGRSASPAESEVVRSAFARVGELSSRAPQRLAHRDLQSTNLHVVGSPTAGKASLRMIDLQGAFMAPPEYDLVCLLRDSYVTLPEEEIREQLARVRPQLPDRLDADELRHRFDCLTLTRKGKDHARFLQAASERGDDRFLRYLAPTVASLRSAARGCACRDPAFADLADLIDQLPEPPCAP